MTSTRDVIISRLASNCHLLKLIHSFDATLFLFCHKTKPSRPLTMRSTYAAFLFLASLCSFAKPILSGSDTDSLALVSVPLTQAHTLDGGDPPVVWNLATFFDLLCNKAIGPSTTYQQGNSATLSCTRISSSAKQGAVSYVDK